ncbi:MAG TPA: hypothetical protein V6D43_04610 [Candidatus Sericytochromatia bacterium]|jgi:hypothetical protein
MSQNKDTTGSYSGFSTGTGLRLWLFFLFCFYFLGYSVPLSILFGAAGGLAGALVMGWWKTKDDPNALMQLIPDESEELENTSLKVSGLRRAKQRRDARRQNRLPAFLAPVSRFFVRGNSSKK